MHMRWHKKGERENSNMMVHPSNDEAWKALDIFDLDFATDARNVCIELATGISKDRIRGSEGVNKSRSKFFIRT
jgi:hypothetical protein